MTIVDLLECPWSPRRNEHVRDEAVRRCARSLVSRALPGGKAAEWRLGTCIDLARWCFPDLDTWSVALVVAWLEELFCADDLRDAPGGVAIEPHLSKAWLDALSERCGTGWREVIETLFAEHVSSVTWERTWRERREPPPLDEYLRHRARAGGIYICISLGPALQGLAPSSRGWRDRRLQRAMFAAANHVSWSNDLVGADRERGEENLVNLPAVLQHHGGVSPREAIDETVRRCNDAARTVQECVAALGAQSAGPSVLAGDARWLGEMLAGHLAWCRASARYASGALNELALAV
jgi:hypothetical protein